MTINLVEFIAEKQHQSPCQYGNIVDGHACYCHHESDIARKCPIWRNYGEHDHTKWHDKGDFELDENWDGGCKYFRRTP